MSRIDEILAQGIPVDVAQSRIDEILAKGRSVEATEPARTRPPINPTHPLFLARQVEDATGFKAETYLRHGAAELASVPGSLPGLVGLAEAGIRYAAPHLMGHAEQGVPTPSIEEAALSTRGRERLRIIEDETIPIEERTRIAEEFDPIQDLNWGLRHALEWYNFGSDTADIERTPGEVPLDEEVAGIMLTLPVGAPTSVINKLTNRVAATIGQRAAKSVAVRASARAIEMVTPLTLPLTVRNMAWNGGIQLALNDIIRTVGDETSVINYVTEGIDGEEVSVDPVVAKTTTGIGRAALTSEETVPEDAGRDHDNLVNLGLLTGSAAFLAWLGKRAIRSPLVEGVSGGESFQRHGVDPNLAAPGTEQVPISGGRYAQTIVQDTSTPIRQSAKEAVDDDFADMVDAMISADTNAGLESSVNTFARVGRLPDGTHLPSTAAIKGELAGLDTRKPISNSPAPGIQTQRQLAEAYFVAQRVERYRGKALIEAQDEISRLRRAVIDALAKGDIRAADRAQLAKDELLTALPWVQKARFAMQDWDETTVQRIIAAGSADPRIQSIDRMVRQTYDGLLDYRVRTGESGAQSVSDMRARWLGVYAPLQEARWGALGRKGTLSDNALYLKTRVKEGLVGAPRDSDKHGRSETISLTKSVGLSIDDIKAQAEIARREAKGIPLDDNLSIAKKNMVNNPMDVVSALDAYASQTIRRTQTNSVRRRVVEFMLNNTKTEKTVRHVATASRKQIATGNLPKGFKDSSRYLPIAYGDKVKFFEFGNDMIRRALEFAPYSTSPFWGTFRRIKQATLTGKLAPHFAPTALIWDAQIGALTRKHGRFTGVVDEAIQRATKGSVGFRGDPTFYLQAAFGVTEAAAREFQRHAGEYISQTLAHSSGIFAKMIQTAVGKKQLQAVGESIVASFARSKLGIMRYRAGLEDVSSFIPAHDAIKGLPDITRNPFNPFRAYSILLDSIHIGAKYAFFARNIAAEARKAGVKPVNLPKSTIIRLGRDTRALSGDITRRGLSEKVQHVTDMVPYSNTIIQSTAHVFGTVAKDFKSSKGGIAFGLFNSIAFPAAAGLYYLEQAGPDALNWYYNLLPDWERTTHIILPDPVRYFERATNGEPNFGDEGYVFDEQDFVRIRIAPELAPLKEGFLSGLRSLGFGSGFQRESAASRDLYEAGASLFGIMLPSPIEAILEGSGLSVDIDPAALFRGQSPLRERSGLMSGAFEDRTYINSELHADVMGAMVSLFGTTAQIGADMYEAGDEVGDAGGTLMKQFEAALTEGTYQVARRTPIVSAIYGIDSQYASTPLTERYYETARELGSVFKMFDIMANGIVGNTDGAIMIPDGVVPPPQIKRDVDGIPASEIMRGVSIVHDLIDGNPVVRQLIADMADISKTREVIRGQRSMDPAQRQELLNAYELRRQNTARQLGEHVLDPLENILHEMYGPDMTARGFARLVYDASKD